MAIQFLIGQSGDLEWFHKGPDTPILSEQEAMIIAVSRLAGGMTEIAKGLDAIASAVGDVAREMKLAAE